MQIDSFLAYTIGIFVYSVGMCANGKVRFLRTYSIPEPVTGGIVAALLALVVGLWLTDSLRSQYSHHVLNHDVSTRQHQQNDQRSPA